MKINNIYNFIKKCNSNNKKKIELDPDNNDKFLFII